MQTRLLPLALLLAVGCTGTEETDDGTPPDAGTTVDTGTPDTGTDPQPDAGPIVDTDAGTAGATVIAGGDVAGEWCGVYQIEGNITVPAGQTLSICAGSELGFLSNTGLQIDGTVTATGDTASIRFYPLDAMWNGISIAGTFTAEGIDVSGAVNCIWGRAGSTLDVDRAILNCNSGLRTANGGVFRHVMVIGGSSVAVNGGILDMADSTIDLRHPNQAPDCTSWSGGGATLDHVLFTGCHCPLHFGATTMPVMVTNSIFEGAVATMIASTQGTFTHNHFLGAGVDFLDIGGPFTAEISGNYWGGNAPNLSSDDQTQFTGGADYSTTPFDDVGPR